MKLRLAAYLSALAFLVGPGYALGASASTDRDDRVGNDYRIFMGFDDVLNASAIVARVRLISRVAVGTRPVKTEKGWRPALGEGPHCGFLYTADVVESFRGEAGRFQFFAGNDDDFSGFDHDYFVVVYERPDFGWFDPDPLTLTFSGEQVREFNCLISQRYYVARLPQTMFSFDPVASKQFGGDWLAPPNREALGWCPYSEDSKLFHDRMVHGAADSYGLASWNKAFTVNPNAAFYPPKASYPARNWSEYRDELIANLGAGPYLAC